MFGPFSIRSHTLHALYVDQLSLFLFPCRTLYSPVSSSKLIAEGVGRGFLLAACCGFFYEAPELQHRKLVEQKVKCASGR